MGIMTSLFVFAVGAILRVAVLMSSYRFNVHSLGVFSMIVGVIGFGLSLMFWESWGGLGGFRQERIPV